MKLKRIFAAVTAFALCASLAGCGAAATVSESAAESAAESAVEATPAVTEAPATEETADASEAALRVAGLKGPTTMGLVNLMSDEVASNYNFTMYGAADEIVPLLVKGDLDAAAVPANLAATLYNKTNGAVEVACINTLGVLNVVTGDANVASFGDLAGHTVYMTGKGTTPEYVLRYLLTKNGLDPDKDVKIEYYSEASEVTAQMATTQDAIAVLPQPYVTAAQLKDSSLRVVLDLTKEWNKVCDTQLITGVIAPESGTVRLKGDRVAVFDPNGFIEHGVSHVPEDRNLQGLIGDMSIAENLVLKDTDDPRFSHGHGLRLNKRAIHAYAQSMMEKYDVRATSDSQSVRELSGGNQQKVIIARELESGPSVLVMAHPTRGLDIGATSFVHDQMIAARARGVGILLISADFDEILEMSDRIVVCFEGRIMGEFSGSKPPINEISLAMTGK